MDKVKGRVKSKPGKVQPNPNEFKDTARQIISIESAVDELNREAVRHEHRGLVARQGARDLLEEGKKKEARSLIEQMLSERNYVVACGVTSRRIKRLTLNIKEIAKKAGGVTRKVAKAVGDVELAIKGSVLAEIEDALNILESALNPQLEPASSVIELVSTVKVSDVDQLQRELEGEIAVLSNLSLGKSMSSTPSRFNTRKYKLEKKLDRGDTLNTELNNIRSDSEDEATVPVSSTQGDDDDDDNDGEEGEEEDEEEESEGGEGGDYGSESDGESSTD